MWMMAWQALSGRTQVTRVCNQDDDVAGIISVRLYDKEIEQGNGKGKTDMEERFCSVSLDIIGLAAGTLTLVHSSTTELDLSRFRR
jgi:hypothetical protein